MSDYRLILGNKNYSSWSLRPWLAMRQAGIAFEERVLPMRTPEWDAEIASLSPSGKVPVLWHGELAVWDTLAIMEYLAERHPHAGLWPQPPAARAVARAVAAEMHAGFQALRAHMPMNLRKRLPGRGRGEGVAEDIARIEAIWQDCRKRFGERPGSGGPFLFGAFCAADAMYAPVATRFSTYEVALSPASQAYVDALLALPAMREWYDAGAAEPWVNPASEVA